MREIIPTGRLDMFAVRILHRSFGPQFDDALLQCRKYTRIIAPHGTHPLSILLLGEWFAKEVIPLVA
jgi:hypothetical protein